MDRITFETLAVLDQNDVVDCSITNKQRIEQCDWGSCQNTDTLHVAVKSQCNDSDDCYRDVIELDF